MWLWINLHNNVFCGRSLIIIFIFNLFIVFIFFINTDVLSFAWTSRTCIFDLTMLNSMTIVKSQNTLHYYTMLPLYQLDFTPLWNSYRVGVLFPFKTNNSARFLYRIAFTTQTFWKWYKIYPIGFKMAWNTPKCNGNS